MLGEKWLSHYLGGIWSIKLENAQYNKSVDNLEFLTLYEFAWMTDESMKDKLKQKAVTKPVKIPENQEVWTC